MRFEYSEVFDELFYGNNNVISSLFCTVESENPTVIEISEFHSKVFKLMLQFICDDPVIEHYTFMKYATELSMLAEKFKIEVIKEHFQKLT